MRRRVSIRPMWRHLVRGLILIGACVGGSARCYVEWSGGDPADAPDVECWDWSIPQQWYDAAHRQ